MNNKSHVQYVGSQHHVDLLAEYVQQASHGKLCIVNMYKDHENCRLKFTYSTELEWEAIKDGIKVFENDLRKSRSTTIL